MTVDSQRSLFLLGNEAIAHGAARAGAAFACAYPGTPSTEILETVAKLGGVHAEWCANEKVALETAIGASRAGLRTIVTMKHVGLNVAADPLLTLTETGVNAGLVIVSADDPGMNSSQNEQDNRNYAKFAKIPMFEPSDSQEAYDIMAEAFAVSEEFDTPVLLRSTTKLSHGRGQVVPREPINPDVPQYVKDITKHLMVPQWAQLRTRFIIERLERLRERAEESPLNVIEPGSIDFGIVASGVAYQYAHEAFPEAWFLKLGMSYPLPYRKIAQLYEKVSRVAVVEELDPFIEEHVRMLGLPVVGKEAVPADGELDQDIVRRALETYVSSAPPERRRPVFPPKPRLGEQSSPATRLPVRPPVLCPGCRHRSVFTALKKQKIAAMGDIGCYMLGADPPLNALDCSLCMGASIGIMAGFNEALGRKASAAVIGDSTFFHSGITGLISASYNEAEGVVLILDNRTTAMTGHQGNPGTGVRPDKSQGPAIDLQTLCDGIGVRCTTVDARDYPALVAAIKAEVKEPGLGVIVAQAPCALLTREKSGEVLVDEERCNLCGLCLDIGCPAIAPGDDAVSILASCTGCALCIEVCKRGALSHADADSGGAS
jgi:indolepyruvate ferredoxin oxidoreductase, alpha subunit